MPLTVASVAGLLLPLLSLAAGTSPGPHITDLNVLLPPLITSPVGYRLQGSGGCFSWTWDHHDILSVQPEYNGSSRCSTSARLLSVAPYTRRKETTVYATDQFTGITIRCMVFVDKISRIQIFHHAVKIDLDELATLHIRAFDDEENVFSSLVGLKFLWQFEPKSSESTAIHHLVHVPLKETPLSDCGGFCGDLDTQIELEDRGFGSDLYVVRGTEIGHEVVSAQLLEPQLEHVMDKIILTVAEAMSLDPPSPVVVTVGALINYSLRVIRMNTPQVITLPSPHHQWSATNSTVAQVDGEMGIAYARNLGITDIVVEDTRLSGHVQTSCMHVVVPDKLVLYLVPLAITSYLPDGGKTIPSSVIWYVFPGQEYIIHMRVFSQGPDVKEIHVTEINDLKLESSTKYWDLVTDEVSVTHDKQKSRLLKPIFEGQGTLTASLNYYSENKERLEALKVVQEVIVCSKVKLSIAEEDESTQIIRLPWAPRVHQEVELRGDGGCGRILEDYIWFSSDEAVVSVSASGLLRSKNPGRAVIKVVSVFDSINFDEVVVEVSVPSSMIVLPNFPVEAVTGTQLEAAVTLKTSDVPPGDYYSKCDAFNSIVRWKVFSDNETFKVLNTTMKKSFTAVLSRIEGSNLHVQPCAWTHLYAFATGRATLHATLSTELQPSAHFKDGLIRLKAVSSLAAYSPLVIHQAENGNQFGGYWIDLARTHADIHEADPTLLNDLYLAPGSWMDVLLLGGPERWDKEIEHIETAEVTSQQEQSITGDILVQRVSSSGGRLYRVLCQTLGEYKLLFSRGNLAGEGHLVPAIANAELLVTCSFPSSITLIANEPANRPGIIEAATKADRNPGRVRTAPVTVANGCIIRMAAVGIHTSGRAFANSSSLCLRWDLNGCEELAHWNENLSYESSLETAWERFLVLHNGSGLCTIRATVSGFAKSTASHFYEKNYLLVSEEHVLTDAIRLQLVSTLRIIPESVLLVFYPEAKVNLSVVGGTCFLDAAINDTQVAELSPPAEGVECSHLELSARGLGSALVTVWDIGLSPPAAASVLVRIANVEWIKIISDEEISLMEGTAKTFDILAGTQDGLVFDYSQYDYMNMHVHIDDGILELVNMNDSSGLGGWIISRPHFSVKAAILGIATLYVTIRQQNGREIPSQMIKVEVYKPLSLHPEYVYLAPGAYYMLTVKGGPKHGAFIEYASMDEEVATIQGSSGRVSAISIGNATIRAAVLSSGGTLICEAYGRIQVGIPTAMILNLQSDQLCIDCKMPIFPSFPEGNLFSFYEICSDYKWKIENEKVLAFQTPSSLHSGSGKISLSCAAGKTNLCHLEDSDSAFINVVSGRSAGRTKVSISFSCDFVSSDVAHRVSYNASEMLTVVAHPPLALGIPITWILPPFYTSSDRLPASTDSYVHKLSHDRKRSTTYSVLKACGRSDLSKQDAIVIDGSKIRTRESNELACIQAKDQTTGRIEIASCVRIAEVAQVRASTAESVFHVAYLAKGAKVELAINYCDDLGYPFSEAHGVIPLDVETNYPDIVTIQRQNDANKTDAGYGNVFLEARTHGRALVMVTIKHKPEKADFILVSVGAQLYPQNPVILVGRKLNFTLIGYDMHGLGSGQWSSDNESVLSVNRISGEARARGEGSAQVIFEGSNLKLQTTVTVLKADQILVDSPAETLTNVPSPPEGYWFPVKFSDPYGKFEVSEEAVKVLYDCRVDPPFVGYAKSWSDHITGNSYCLFFPYPPKHLLNSPSKSKTIRSQENDRNDGFMYVSIIASLREAPQVQGAAHALFVGGFSIEDVRKLNLTPISNKSLIRVIGNTDVEIYWSSKDLLLVTPYRTDGFGISGVREYEVEVLKDQKFADKLIIVLPATGQQAEIDVNFEPHGKGSIMKEAAGMSSITWSAIGICVVVLVATILIFMKMLDRPRGVSHTPSPVTAGSPMGRRDHSSGSPAVTSSVQSSPRTPSQPFVEYVRRTIDETPYYKRSGRRRFDPQYTY